MDSTSQVSEQAASAGDVQTSTPEGQATARVSIVNDANAANDDAKNQRISQKEWQRRTEEAQQGSSLKDKVRETLGVEDPDKLDAIARQLTELKEESTRKDWEFEHPIVREEKYKYKWMEAAKQKLDPASKYHRLDYSEIWKLIRDDSESERVSKVREELKAQDQQSPGVPMVSKTQTTSQGMNPDTLNMLRAIYPNITEKEAMELG